MLSEEIEAVKKYLTHEYQIYTEVTSTRAGKEPVSYTHLQATPE